jgi:hypothetical protein
MDENAIRTLLRDIAETPEPAPRIDVDEARRRGRRRRWIRRSAASLAAVVAVAALAAVPRVFASPERSTAFPARPPASAPASARTSVPNPPAQFNPLVPYAGFGWLPSGFSEGSVPPWMETSSTSDPSMVTRTAISAVGYHMLTLNVGARGDCASKGKLIRCVTGDGTMGFAPTGAAPDVSGRPAIWVNNGEGIAWEYAPGAWATLTASVVAKQGTVAAPSAGQTGWATTTSAATRALLLKTAGHVTFGDKTPVVFPFRLTAPLPRAWRLQQVSFAGSGGRLAGTGLTVGPAADPSALLITASKPLGFGCTFVTGQSSYVFEYGVHWTYRVINQSGKYTQMLCSTSTVDGQQVWINLDMSAAAQADISPVLKKEQLGGALAVYSRLRFLGANPVAWTPSPLG